MRLLGGKMEIRDNTPSDLRQGFLKEYSAEENIRRYMKKTAGHGISWTKLKVRSGKGRCGFVQGEKAYFSNSTHANRARECKVKVFHRYARNADARCITFPRPISYPSSLFDGVNNNTP
jgi:hypothetical protein